MAMAPYPGQGDPLGATAGYTGEWIIRGDFFLCKGMGTSLAGLKHISSGKIAIGFSADDLAARLGISADELMERNRRKELSVVESQPLAASGGTAIRIFAFSLLGSSDVHLVRVQETLP